MNELNTENTDNEAPPDGAEAPVETPEPAGAEAGEESEPAATAEPGDEPADEPEPEEEPVQVQYLRLRADFDNFRKRIDREKAEWSQRANERLVGELLPVLDSFDLGLANDTGPGTQDGLRLVHEQMLKALAKFGLAPVDAVGEVFDPERHEAINRMPSPEHDVDVVCFQSRRGYLIGDKLLRPAQVVVSTGQPENGG